jgi:hypothetical protein
MTFVKAVVGAVEHHGRQPSDRISCPSDSVVKCRGGFWQDENVGPKTLSATPFYMAWIDLGPQPWFGYASRSWHKSGGSDLFLPRERFQF